MYLYTIILFHFSQTFPFSIFTCFSIFSLVIYHLTQLSQGSSNNDFFYNSCLYSKKGMLCDFAKFVTQYLPTQLTKWCGEQAEIIQDVVRFVTQYLSHCVLQIMVVNYSVTLLGSDKKLNDIIIYITQFLIYACEDKTSHGGIMIITQCFCPLVAYMKTAGNFA